MFGILLLFSTPVIVPVQDACPMVYVSPSTPEKGKASFTAMISGGKGDPTFNWSISAGTITAGQGTVLIAVEADPGENVTATVDIGGYPPECATSSSATAEISAIDASACPNFGIDLIKSANGEAVFNATADKPAPGNPQIDWRVSEPGAISSGQGTGSITVAAPAGTKLTTSYTLTGLPSACKDRASGDFTIE